MITEMKEKRVFVGMKTYLDSHVGYFAKEYPLLWAATPDLTQAHQFKTRKAAQRVQRRWLADQYSRALEVHDGRERCPIEVVEVRFPGTMPTAAALSSLALQLRNQSAVQSEAQPETQSGVQ